MTTQNGIKRWLRRTAAVVLPGAILAAVIAVAPSFAGGSFLTHQQAVKTFVKKKQAKKVYLETSVAREKYAKVGDVPPAPVARALSSTVVAGPVTSKDPYDLIPTARTTFKVPSTSLVAITFSGSSVCTAAKAGVGCPIQILVDGSPASTSDPKLPANLNFDVSGSGTPAPSVHTTTQTTIVTPGQHAVTVRYAGTKDTSVNFKLTSWNLVVQAYPGPDVVEEEKN